MNTKATLIRNEQLLFEFLRSELKNVFDTGGKIAVKIHMGEPGNQYYIKASFTKHIVDVLKEAGCSSFIFDTPVAYRSPRNNPASYLNCAADHGYTEQNVGAPIIISDRGVPVKGTHMTYRLALDPIEADGVLLLTHFKGHIASGMGGTIKNIGMGCVSKVTKGAIHEGGEPYYTEGCTRCNACVENCPTDNIRIENDHPRFDNTWCPGCSNCILSCPEKCISPRIATFDELLSEAAVLAHDRFRKVYAVNVLKNITRLCDCIADSGPVIVNDIGFICGGDMLTVDIASLESVRKTSGRDDVFSDYNKRSSWEHVRSAARLMNRSMNVSINELH